MNTGFATYAVEPYKKGYVIRRTHRFRMGYEVMYIGRKTRIHNRPPADLSLVCLHSKNKWFFTSAAMASKIALYLSEKYGLSMRHVKNRESEESLAAKNEKARAKKLEKKKG